MKCKTHPNAPHGFDRNASHSSGDYVCECESWEPEENEMTETRWDTIVHRFTENLASGEYTLSECLSLFIDDYGYIDDIEKQLTDEHTVQFVEREMAKVWDSISNINDRLTYLMNNKADKVTTYKINPHNMSTTGCGVSPTEGVTTVTINGTTLNAATATEIGGGGTYNFGGIKTK